jgi:hypothetical protein
MPVVLYESMSEFSASLPPTPKKDKSGDSWSGGNSYSESKKLLWRGDSKAVKKSDALLDKLEGDGIELHTTYWDNDRTGFIPCVPSYLAGSPDSMRRLVEVPSDTSPMKIFASVCLSGGFDASQLETRGTAILALTRKLSLIRPIELFLYADMHGSDSKDGNGHCAIPVVRVETSPLDLTTASYAIANAGFLRQLCFNWGYARGFDGSWAWNSPPQTDNSAKNLKKSLNIGDNDLVIHGAYLSDELMREPLKWVNNQVKKYASAIEE